MCIKKLESITYCYRLSIITLRVAAIDSLRAFYITDVRERVNQYTQRYLSIVHKQVFTETRTVLRLSVIVIDTPYHKQKQAKSQTVDMLCNILQYLSLVIDSI